MVDIEIKPHPKLVRSARSEDTLNKNLPTPISQFSPNAKLSTMRKETESSTTELRPFNQDRLVVTPETSVFKGAVSSETSVTIVDRGGKWQIS
jgi:hypothetical protein